MVHGTSGVVSHVVPYDDMVMVLVVWRSCLYPMTQRSIVRLVLSKFTMASTAMYIKNAAYPEGIAALDERIARRAIASRAVICHGAIIRDNPRHNYP